MGRKPKILKVKIKKVANRPYSCSCGKTFKEPGRLKRHQKVHTDERQKRFACTHPGCLKRFMQSSDMKRHVKHVHTKDRPFSCKIAGCGKSFKEASKLKRHKRTHAG